MLNVEIFDQKDLTNNQIKQVVKFYLDMDFNSDYDFKVAIENSVLIGIASKDDVIIGAGRIVGDKSRFSYLVDLVVDVKHRGRGVGKLLAKKLALSCDTLHVSLTTDPSDPKLEYFYRKAGFEKSEGEQVFSWPG